MAIGKEVDLLFRKVDRRFDVDAQADQLFGEVMHTLRKRALQRTQGIARRLCRTGFNQVSDGFGLGQVEFVVEKGALTELTRACQTTAQLQTALQQHVEYDRATVALKFEHVFAGK